MSFQIQSFLLKLGIFQVKKKGLKSPYLKRLGSCIVAITSTLQIEYRHLANSFFFPPHFRQLKFIEYFIFEFLIFNFSSWRNFASKKNVDLCFIRNQFYLIQKYLIFKRKKRKRKKKQLPQRGLELRPTSVFFLGIFVCSQSCYLPQEIKRKMAIIPRRFNKIWL